MSSLLLNDLPVSDDLHFFILEDDPIFQKKMISTLGDIGFKGKITVKANVADAKAAFKKARPDFFLSDWNLPDGTGIEFLKEVRSDDSFSAVPFLMVTTMDDIGNILEAIHAGADGYIVKPWSEEDVIEKMSFSIEKRRG